MANSLREGARVQIVNRKQTSADVRSGLYYPHYAGLTGAIFKLYTPGDQAAVEIDIDSLPEDVARRHLEARDRLRATLTGEAKRMSAPGAPHELHLRYVVLVSASDLVALKQTPVRAAKLPVANGNGHKKAA